MTRECAHQVAAPEGKQGDHKGASEQDDKTHAVAFDIPVFVP
jgi:hypothetical protein